MKYKYIRDLEDRISSLEKKAGLFDVFSATKRQLKSEEKEIKNQFESLSGIDFAEVSINTKGEDYKGLKLNDMKLRVSYLGETYDLVGRRVESLTSKRTASPYFFFDQSRRRRRKKPVSVSQLSSGVRSVEKVEVHYKISFPKRTGYFVKVYTEGKRGGDIRELFGENIEMYRGY